MNRSTPPLRRLLARLFILSNLAVAAIVATSVWAGLSPWAALALAGTAAALAAPALARHALRDLRRDLAATIAFARWARGTGAVAPPLRAHSAGAQHLMQAVAAMAAALQNHRAQLDLLNREAEQANAELEQNGRRLAAALARKQELSVLLVGAQERERKHLARELHDELGQRLTALSFMLHSLRPHLSEERARTLCANALVELAQLVADVRRMSVSLRPPALDLVSLDRAVGQLLERMFGGSAIACTFDAPGLPEQLSEAVEITAYRLVQESTTNIVRHAGATSVSVEMSCQDGELEVLVRDNGRGFDPGAVHQRGGGSGLPGMAERVRLVGGELAIDSALGQGTRIRAQLPIQLPTSE